MPEGLWFADSLQRASPDVFDQFVDSFRDSLVGLLPVEVVLPSFWGENEIHASRSIFFASVFPFSRLSRADTSLLAFAGLLRR